MMPNATGLLADSYAEQERGRALGLCLGISGAFLALGPVVGGLLVEAFGWRSVFVLNLPVIACVSGLVLLRVPGRDGDAGAKIGDSLGVALAIAGVVAAVIALMEAPTWGWTSAGTIALGGAALAVLAIAIVRELRIQAPFFHLRLFARRTYAGASLAVSANRLAVVIATVYVSIYLQQARGLDASIAGIALLALAVPTVVVAPLAGRLSDRLGSAGVCNFGMAMTAAGAFVVAIGVERQGTALAIAGLVPIAIGSGVVQPSANLAAMNTVAGEEESEAFGLMAACRQLAATLGLAVIGGIVAASGTAAGFYVTAALCTAAALATAWLLRRAPAAA
jgi:predicted MFS family arabinose efflux permease